MCGRFTQSFPSPEFLAQQFRLDDWPRELMQRYNLAPTQHVFAIVDREFLDGRVRRQLLFMKWGLVPFWAKGPAIGSMMINARAETLLEKPAFKRLVARQRCVIPADSFYEWQRPKEPLRIHLDERPAFGFAGLYDHWHAPNGDTWTSCTIITCAPNDFMAAIHRRMPVILDSAAVELWLDPTITESEVVTAVLRPTADPMRAYRVHPEVGNVRNDTIEWSMEYHPS